MPPSQHKLIQAYQQVPWRGQLQLIGLFSLGLVLVAVVAAIYLNVTARAATIGREIQQLQQDLLVIQRTNADMQTQLALLTSARVMEARARALGFVPQEAGEILYLQVPGFSGRQEVVLAPPPGPVASTRPALPPEYTQTLIELVQEFARSHSLLEVQP